jgi:hypothetical protein
VLSELPGTTLKQNVKDPLGRVGTQISMPLIWKDRGKPGATPTVAFSGSEGSSFIIDPQTGRLLSSAFGLRGKGTGVTVVLESGWTDERPTPPSKKTR